MRRISAVGAAALILATACTKDSAKKADEPVAATPAAGSQPAAGEGGAKTATPATPAPAPDPNCAALPKLPGEPPYYVAGMGVVLTRLMKTCVTTDGHKGYDKATPFLAMGFPCTGGSGRVDIKGHYNNPKMISFILGTDCAMMPGAKDQAHKIVADAVGLPKEAKLMAYTPFVVQYWEVPGLTDADVGFSIDLRSAPALEGTWRRLQKNEPLHVKLYGRENAWVAGGQFFQVEGDLKMTGRNSFQLAVGAVKSLSEQELADVRNRCEALRPARSCKDVF